MVVQALCIVYLNIENISLEPEILCKATDISNECKLFNIAVYVIRNFVSGLLLYV